MAEEGYQRLNAIRQIICSLFHALGSENIDLQKLSGEKSHWIPIIVKLGYTDPIFKSLAH